MLIKNVIFLNSNNKHFYYCEYTCLIIKLAILLYSNNCLKITAATKINHKIFLDNNDFDDHQLNIDRLLPRRRQSQATLLSHKQNLITGSANSPLTSPYNQFYLTNNVNSPHNGKFFFQSLVFLFVNINNRQQKVNQ